ncbi:hypothetical protein AAVH_31080, partial [Aphelenchoides avenae]
GVQQPSRCITPASPPENDNPRCQHQGDCRGIPRPSGRATQSGCDVGHARPHTTPLVGI